MNDQLSPMMRKKEVLALTRFCNATLYNYIKAGTFPRPVPMGSRMVVWRRSEVQAWVDAIIKPSPVSEAQLELDAAIAAFDKRMSAEGVLGGLGKVKSAYIVGWMDRAGLGGEE